MAKKETRRDASLRLAIILLMLAISQAFAPAFVLGSRFSPHHAGGDHLPIIILEADKQDWRGLSYRKPGSKRHDRIASNDCLHWSKNSRQHCNTSGGYVGAGTHDAHSQHGENQGTDSGGAKGLPGRDDAGVGSDFVIGNLIGGGTGGGTGGGSGGTNSGGGFGGGLGSGGFGVVDFGGGDSLGGSGGKDISGGGSGGGAGGGSSGTNSSAGPGGAFGDGTTGGSGDDGGAGGSGGGSSGGGPGASGGTGGDPISGCEPTDTAGCIPGDRGGSGCSLSNPEACTNGDRGNGGDQDCLKPDLCNLPTVNVLATTQVPEPSTLWLMSAGIAALVARRRREKLATTCKSVN